MGRLPRTQIAVLGLLGDGVPRGVYEISIEIGKSSRAVESACYRAWRGERLLRSEVEQFGRLSRFRGRAGTVSSQRGFFLYVLRPDGFDSLQIDGVRFVPYGVEYLSGKVPKGLSKAQRIIDYLREHGDRAFYSLDVYEALKGEGVNQPDVMSTVRRYERKGLVYVRGYRSESHQTPFTRGFLITWLDDGLSRKKAISEAFQRTERVLMEPSTSNITGQRVRMVRDQVISDAQLREITSRKMLRNKLKCTNSQLDSAIKRTLQLYSDVKDIHIFGQRYLYHTSLDELDLRATIKLKENYIRKTGGRNARIGHNWEAAVEWFLDKFTQGAKFRTQNHRDPSMDKRRITLHLIRSVGGRRQNAEVDRVWTTKSSPFTQEVTYVLQSKWGLVRKADLDDHLEVLKWSQEFGVDTGDGQAIQQGVIPIFAGGAFDPNSKIRIGDEEISLAQYAHRMRIELLKASDFNQQLQQKNVEQYVTVQKVCQRARDEEEVRDTLQKIWNQPKKARTFLVALTEKNQELFEFEKQLEMKNP